MKENVIVERSFQFALRTIALCRTLRAGREFELALQLFKAGTSIGANVEEAQSAQSRPDFLSRMSIAAREARESRYRLRLMAADPVLGSLATDDELSDAEVLLRILRSIVKTTGESDAT